MANTYELIQTITLSSGQSSISFSSIPQTYTDLLLKTSIRDANSSDNFSNDVLRFNNDTGNNYNRYSFRSSGASTDSASSTGFNYIVYQYQNGGTATTNAFGSSEVYIFGYTASTNKLVLYHASQETNSTSPVYQTLHSAAWLSSSAINTITITSLNSFNFVQYASASLYGIKNS